MIFGADLVGVADNAGTGAAKVTLRPAGSGGPTGGVFGLPTGGFPLRRDEGLKTLDFQGNAIQYCYLEIGRVSMTKGLRVGGW